MTGPRAWLGVALTQAQRPRRSVPVVAALGREVPGRGLQAAPGPAGPGAWSPAPLPADGGRAEATGGLGPPAATLPNHVSRGQTNPSQINA